MGRTDAGRPLLVIVVWRNERAGELRAFTALGGPTRAMMTPDPQQWRDADAEEFDNAERLLRRFADHPEDFEEVPGPDVSPARLGVVISVASTPTRPSGFVRSPSNSTCPTPRSSAASSRSDSPELERPGEAAPNRRRVLMDVEIDAAGHLLQREAG